MKTIIKKSFYFGIIVLIFAYGMCVGHYKWYPFETIFFAKRDFFEFLFPVTKEREAFRRDWFLKDYQGEQEMLNYAFQLPLTSKDKIYPPISELDGIAELVDKTFMPVADFEEAYQNLTVTKTEQLLLDSGVTKVIRIRFLYKGVNHEGYAYGEIPDTCGLSRAAALVIPGSGWNQSNGIYTRDKKNYHYGIYDALESENGVDSFIYIKPNEDILAWHDGSKKLRSNFYVGNLLNRGGSYSASYIIQSLAISKYLRSCYGKTIVAGLSQGGAAALIHAIQSKPDIAIIASGYSVINQIVEWSGALSIVGIPIKLKVAYPEELARYIKNSPTQYQFTWGRNEIGMYRMEAYEQRSCQALKDIKNIECVIHDQGHVFHVAEIRSFLGRYLGNN